MNQMLNSSLGAMMAADAGAKETFDRIAKMTMQMDMTSDFDENGIVFEMRMIDSGQAQ